MLAPIDVSEPVRQLPKPELPPARYGLGIGSPEDSLQNCLRLVPKPPKRDNYRWQKLVRNIQHARRPWRDCWLPGRANAAAGHQGLCPHVRPIAPAGLPAPPPLQDTVVLRFEAALEPAEGRRLISIDHERRFVVSFYMAGALGGGGCWWWWFEGGGEGGPGWLVGLSPSNPGAVTGARLVRARQAASQPAAQGTSQPVRC